MSCLCERGSKQFSESYSKQFSRELGQYFPFYSVTLKGNLLKTQQEVQDVHKASIEGRSFDGSKEGGSGTGESSTIAGSTGGVKTFSTAPTAAQPFGAMTNVGSAATAVGAPAAR